MLILIFALCVKRLVRCNPVRRRGLQTGAKLARAKVHAVRVSFVIPPFSLKINRPAFRGSACFP